MSKLSLEQQAQVDELSRDGIGQRTIAATIGESYGAVRYYLESKQADQYENRKLADYVAPYDSKEIQVEPFKAFVWDLETTNLKADIGELRVAAFLDLHDGKVLARTVDYFEGSNSERELQLALWTRGMYESADILIGHNTLAFDRHFLQTVLVRHGQPALSAAYHIDTYQVARYGLKFSGGKSLANLADILGLELGKDKPSKNDWRMGIGGDRDAVKRLMVRCVEDVRLNALLWQHPEMRAAFRKWKGQR